MGVFWGYWFLEVGKWFNYIQQVRHFFNFKRTGGGLPVLVTVGTLWFWRSSEIGCSAMIFPTSARQNCWGNSLSWEYLGSQASNTLSWIQKGTDIWSKRINQIFKTIWTGSIRDPRRIGLSSLRFSCAPPQSVAMQSKGQVSVPRICSLWCLFAFSAFEWQLIHPGSSEKFQTRQSLD